MEFPRPHVRHAQGPHTHTFILLHGRASNGPEFAEELFSSATSTGENLAACLPSWRWVFPTSRELWSTVFEEEICAWFDAYSLDDIQKRNELQREGLRESALHILDILDSEIRLLDGKASHVDLGGISQGMATALWTFFGGVATSRIERPLGGLLGFCGWLPFAQQLEDLLQQSTPDSSYRPQMLRLVADFFVDTILDHKAAEHKNRVDTSVVAIPVFLSHGADDAWISVELGRQASRILQKLMVDVEWNEFTGAEADGHWIKEPDGFDQILRFLRKSAWSSSEGRWLNDGD